MDRRVAVVTGANRGLGLEIVRQLAATGLHVVLACRSVTDGEAAARGLGDFAQNVSVQQLNVTDRASIARFTSELHGRLGRCDVLVNNAAIMIDGPEDAAAVHPGVVWRTLETNLMGAWLLTQAVVPAMRTRQYGRIVNVSSAVGRLTSMQSGVPAYRVSKCALNAITRIFADELSADKILVNACCPGRLAPGWGRNAVYVPLPEAADTPVWLATLPADGPTGGFYRNRNQLEW